MKRDDRDVLVIVDIQNDFCPGGALAVPHGDQIVPAVNRLAAEFAHVVLTQDWHPRDHASFASSHAGKTPFDTIDVSYGQQILWPDHCVQGTRGAAFHPDLDVPHAELVLRKGFRTAIDSYSAFFENDHRTPTGLVGYLKERRFLNASRCAGSPPTFACSLRRSTVASPGSRSRSRPTRAVALTSTARLPLQCIQ
jgi:nicotinamidase/pyrazinamidase